MFARTEARQRFIVLNQPSPNLRGRIRMHQHKGRFNWASWSLALCALLFWASTLRAQTTAFTYQGKLTDGGNPANANYDLQFTLWDAASGGTQQPQPAPITVTRNNVSVSGGIFTERARTFLDTVPNLRFEKPIDPQRLQAVLAAGAEVPEAT